MTQGVTTRSLGAALALLLALAPAPALAQSWTDYRQAAEDQYGTPPGTSDRPSNGGAQGAVAGEREEGGSSSGSGSGSGSGSDGGGGVAGERERGGGLPLRDAEGGALPFTGFDLALLVLIATGLAGAGFAIRLATRRGQRA